MADVSHELGSLRFVVDSPLSSKVAKFNNQVQQHQQSQLLNPFSGGSGRSSPKPSFSKEEYGKPLAGSITEMRGQKANMHVLKEMLELCQIINTEGYNVKDEPNMRVIPFGELFNIYNYISDKVVGILLRARKHKLVEFEGEMLFQRRDDDVPIFLLKPIAEIRQELNEKIELIKRGSSPAPQATSLLLDKGAHEKKLQEAGLMTPKNGGSKANSKSRSPSPKPKSVVSSNASSPTPSDNPENRTTDVNLTTAANSVTANSTVTPAVIKPIPSNNASTAASPLPEIVLQTDSDASIQINSNDKLNVNSDVSIEINSISDNKIESGTITANSESFDAQKEVEIVTKVMISAATENKPQDITCATPQIQSTAVIEKSSEASQSPSQREKETANKPADVNNNINTTTDGETVTTEIPTIVIEATAVYVRSSSLASTVNDTTTTIANAIEGTTSDATITSSSSAVEDESLTQINDIPA